MDDYKKTEDLLLKVITHNNINPIAYKNLGDLYRRVNKLEKNHKTIQSLSDVVEEMFLKKPEKYNSRGFQVESCIRRDLLT